VAKEKNSYCLQAFVQCSFQRKILFLFVLGAARSLGTGAKGISGQGKAWLAKE